MFYIYLCCVDEGGGGHVPCLDIVLSHGQLLSITSLILSGHDTCTEQEIGGIKYEL